MWTQGFTTKVLLIIIIKREIIGFLLFKSMLWYNHSFEQMFLLIWIGLTGLSPEQCGTWVFCFFLEPM